MRLPRNRILIGDAVSTLARLPAASVDVVLTSPPYFRLRDYGMPDQLGLEPTVEAWTTNQAAVLKEVARVLVPTGSLWLNLGDSYAAHPRQGASRKSLLLGPERLALRLVEEGWLLRNKIVWQKSNPMPSPVRDRLACTWEVLYVFARQPDYFFNLDAIRQPHRTRPTAHQRLTGGTEPETWRGPNAAGRDGLRELKAAGRVGHPLGKNPGDVWRLSSSRYRGPHPATFPVGLAERVIRAGCPERRCIVCRRPWRSQRLRNLGGAAVRSALGPDCPCRAPAEPGLVLDPFMGAGTTGLAAAQLGRDWLGIELNPTFATVAEVRLRDARQSDAPAA